MQRTRFVRTLVPLLMLGLIGFVPGCSDQRNPTPPDKATGKQIAEDIKSARQELKAERAQAKERPNMKDAHRRQ